MVWGKIVPPTLCLTRTSLLLRGLEHEWGIIIYIFRNFHFSYPAAVAASGSPGHFPAFIVCVIWRYGPCLGPTGEQCFIHLRMKNRWRNWTWAWRVTNCDKRGRICPRRTSQRTVAGPLRLTQNASGSEEVKPNKFDLFMRSVMCRPAHMPLSLYTAEQAVPGRAGLKGHMLIPVLTSQQRDCSLQTVAWWRMCFYFRNSWFVDLPICTCLVPVCLKWNKVQLGLKLHR